MRRRERWQGIAWLDWLEGDSPGGSPTGRAVHPVGVHEHLMELCQVMARYVEMEQDSGIYTVRVLPALPDFRRDPVPFGITYTGRDLRYVLGVAVVELEMLHSGDTRFRLGVTERARWTSC